MDYAERILKSWQANAGNWINTIDNNEIESRRLGTNMAVVDTIVSYEPKTLLDIGCGEGWLTRTLRSNNIDAFGIDGIDALVANAIAKGGNHYAVCCYETLLESDGLLLKDKDAVVFNFSLLDELNTDLLMHFLPQHLPKGSHVFIQTLHPLTVAASGPYTTGWKDGSWNVLSPQYVLPYQWYFRTLQSWVELFTGAGLRVDAIKEPLNPNTQQPASIIFVLCC